MIDQISVMRSGMKMAGKPKKRLKQAPSARQNLMGQASRVSSVDYAKLNALFQQGDYISAELEAQRQIDCFLIK